MNADQALNKLSKGNAEFVAAITEGQTVPAAVSSMKMSGAQKPFAVVLGCADSRVPVEMVFSQGVGDLFVVRVAGNVAEPTQIGSIEFACQQFGSQLIVVLGHSQCGAISATVDNVKSPSASLTPNLESIVKSISPAVESLIHETDCDDREELLKKACKQNVLQSVQCLKTKSSVLSELIAQDKLKIVGATYNLHSGQVDFHS